MIPATRAFNRIKEISQFKKKYEKKMKIYITKYTNTLYKREAKQVETDISRFCCQCYVLQQKKERKKKRENRFEKKMKNQQGE